MFISGRNRSLRIGGGASTIALIACGIVAGLLAYKLFSLTRPADSTNHSVGTSETHIWRTTPLELVSVPAMRGELDRSKLRRALQLLSPDWRVTKANNVLHALRLWGIDGIRGTDLNPSDPQAVKAQELLRPILDRKEYRRLGVVPDEVYYRTEFGISVLYSTWGQGGVAHCNQLLKVLGEIGIPSFTPLLMEDERPATVGDLIADSLKRYSEQDELEFSAVAFSRWLPPHRVWRDRYGEPHSFDELANMLVRQKLGAGACLGAHVPYAIVNILRADAEHTILDPPNARILENRLREIVALLESGQTRDGLWYDQWSFESIQSLQHARALDGITVTGHQLEWIALAPENLRPSRACIKKAAQALLDRIVRTDAQSIHGAYAPFSHAVRALLLLEGSSIKDILATP